MAVEEISRNVAPGGANDRMLMCSALPASNAFVVGSTAVVTGATLISPMMAAVPTTEAGGETSNQVRMIMVEFQKGITETAKKAVNDRILRPAPARSARKAL